MSAFSLPQPQENTTSEAKNASEKIACRICGHEAHSIYGHIQEQHGITAEQYLMKYPGAPLLSEFGERVRKQEISMLQANSNLSMVRQTKSYDSVEVFGIGFGANGNVSKPIAGYEGYTRAEGLPDIDPHYVFTDVTRDVLLGMMTGAKIYTVGPTGSGKTTLYEQIAARVGRPFWRQQFHEDMEAAELFGNWTVVEGGKMIFLYSGLVNALRKPSIIVLDEFDSGNPGVTAIANALLEGNPLIISTNGGEIVEPHPDCVIVATGNTNGMGDETGLYASTSQQSYATMNRFSMTVIVDYMKPQEEIDLLKRIYAEKGMPEKEIVDLVKVATDIRNGYKGNRITVPISTRQVIHWCKWLMMTGQPRRSFNLAFANQLGLVDRGVADELYVKVFGNRS